MLISNKVQNGDILVPDYLGLSWKMAVCCCCCSVSNTSGSVHCRSSRLSKSLDEVLHDKDALAYFISYLQSVSADNLIRFWLDVDAFRLATDCTRSTEPVTETADRTFPVEAAPLAAYQTPPTVRCRPVETAVVSEDRLCSKTPEVTQHRVATSDCGHTSAGVNSSPKAGGGRLPAHGQVIISTDAAVPTRSDLPSSLSRVPVDCCPASNPSVSVVTHCLQPGAVQQTDTVSCDDEDIVEAETSTVSGVTSSEDESQLPSKGFISGFIVIVILLVLWHCWFHDCWGIDPVKILHQPSQKVLVWEIFHAFRLNLTATNCFRRCFQKTTEDLSFQLCIS